jgi:hypothetical protein
MERAKCWAVQRAAAMHARLAAKRTRDALAVVTSSNDAIWIALKPRPCGELGTGGEGFRAPPIGVPVTRLECFWEKCERLSRKKHDQTKR